MTQANDLIERAEAETGQRIDDDGGDNMAIDCLIGAISRIAGDSLPCYGARDDLAVGSFIRHRNSLEYRREQRGKEMFAQMLVSGVSFDEIKRLSSDLGPTGK